MSENTRGTIPRKVKGFRDISASDNRGRWAIIRAASQVYQRYGFRHWDTPILEYADSLGKYLPDADTPEEGVYSFRNPEVEPVLDTRGEPLRDGWNNVVMENQFLALRYDLTAPLARKYAEDLWAKFQQAGGQAGKLKAPLFRRYQYGPVFRFEAKLAPGRFREFWQLDFDTVGVADPSCDAEVCLVLCDALEAIGLARGTYEVKVSNRKLIRGLFERVGVAGDEELCRDILRVMDKLDKVGPDGVSAELGPGRKDPESGARIEGLGLGPEVIEPIAAFVALCTELPSREQMLGQLEPQVRGSAAGLEGLGELQRMHEVLASLGYDEERVVFDPSVARGLAYYTGPVFEASSKAEYRDETGAVRRFGSIAGGGRYDDLVERLLGLRVPATGASIGVDRLAELMRRQHESELTEAGPVLITVLDPSRMPAYQAMARELRDAGLDAEVYYGMQRGLKAQLAYADSEHCPAAVIAGDELDRGTVSIKDLRLGKKLSEAIKDREAWQKEQPAQVEVPRSEFVARVKAMIQG